MNKLLINKDFTIKKTFKHLNDTSYKCLIIVEKNTNIVLGTISDGDIRKAIINGINLNDKVNLIYNKKPFCFVENSFTKSIAKEVLLKKKLPFIPVVNKKNVLKKIIFWDDFIKKNKPTYSKKIGIPVLIMAGGIGSRLEPFTKILPKPLIPVNDKPVIDHIIENFRNFNFENFFISINYKSKILKAYFEEAKRKYKISFVEEKKPLGTAGSLKLLYKKIKDNIIVTNCDIMININYLDFVKFHIKNKNDLSFLTFSKNFLIPYGICNTDADGNFTEIIEKQAHNYMINAGMYIVSSKVIKLIPNNEIFHMSDLINKAKLKKFKVETYSIDEDNWIDIGQWNEYKKAVDKL